jgi:hypothetical protein
MAARRAALRALLSAVLLGALAGVASLAGVSPAQAVSAEALLDAGGGPHPAASLQYVHWGRFCSWKSRHPLCIKLINLRRFCDRHPRHKKCDDDDEDRFCRRHPHHHRCHDKPPSPS